MDHNGPQVNPTTSGFLLNNNKLINETGSLCSSDSVEEENEVKNNQVDLSRVKFHSHSEGKQKQYLSRII